MRCPSFQWKSRCCTLTVTWLLTVTCFLGPALVPSLAVANEPDEEYAQERFLEGREAFEAGDYMKAVDTFREVYDILGATALLYNIGEAYRRADQLAEAEEYLQKYLNEEPEAPNADAVVERIIDIQQERAARKASIDIVTEPAEAKIFVDDADEPQCVAPCVLDLDPGAYTLRAELDDYLSLSEDIELDVRDEAETMLELVPETPIGKVVVRTDVDDATVLIGEDRHDLPHPEAIEVEAGHRSIGIEWDGDRIDHQIEIERNETVQLFIPVAGTGGGETPSPLQITTFALGGASLALGLAATTAGLQTRSTHEELQSQSDATGGVDPLLVTTGQRQRSLTNGLWVGAITTFATGVGLWTWDKMRGGKTDSEQPLEPTADEE